MPQRAGERIDQDITALGQHALRINDLEFLIGNSTRQDLIKKQLLPRRAGHGSQEFLFHVLKFRGDRDFDPDQMAQGPMRPLDGVVVREHRLIGFPKRSRNVLNRQLVVHSAEALSDDRW